MHASSRVAVALTTSRLDFIVALAARHSAVAHLGAADSPYTRARLMDGSLLHSRLLDVAGATVFGFDIDAAGLDLVKQHHPEANLHLLDVTAEIPPIHRGRYDCVLAGEVLEHVANPADFLAGCALLLAEGGILCVTVPNACSPKIGIRALFGLEVVHPDHRVYYSPRTLARTLAAAGWHVLETTTYLADAGPAGRIFNYALRAAHWMFRGPVGEGLIAIARRPRSSRTQADDQ